MPHVPVRQWVLTVPHGLRAKLAFDPALTTVVFREFIAAVSSWLRRRARRLGLRGELKTGAVTVIQRFNSAVDLSPHFHALVLDGVYSFPVGRTPVFHPTPAPADEDVARVVTAVFRRVERKLADREPSVGQRRFAEGAPLLIAMAEASARGVVGTGPRRGCRIIRIRGAPVNVDVFLMGRLCAQVEGYNLQAATRLRRQRPGRTRTDGQVPGPTSDRHRQTIVTRRRPAGAAPQATVARWHDGVRVPASRIDRGARRDRTSTKGPPRALQWRAGASLRGPRAIVPCADKASPEAKAAAPPPEGAEMPGRPGRIPWAPLLWRVFLADVLQCARCPGRMRIVAAVTSTVEATRILRSIGLAAEPPAFHAARSPPQAEMPL